MNMVRKESWQRYCALMLIVFLMVVGGCRKQPPTSVVSEENGKSSELESLRSENRKLKNELAQCRAQESAPAQSRPDRDAKEKLDRLKTLEEEQGKLKLLLLEKEAQMKEMELRQASLQRKLDEAIQEVVRAKARLRGLESRAEAASNMAETEVALKMLKSQRPDMASSPELVQAEQLLKMSTREFKKENYGGALYLAGQAKAQIKLSQAQPQRGQEANIKLLPGEVPFALPLDLRVKKKSNVREGPGLNYNVVATVSAESPLKGYSYKGQWVRVKGESNLKGWIFQDLVSGH
jgi:hypothetical protein